MDARSQGELALRQCLGWDATFREGQWEAIEAIALNHERVLVVQKTGWGKSLVYFIATKLLRDDGKRSNLDCQSTPRPHARSSPYGGEDRHPQRDAQQRQ